MRYGNYELHGKIGSGGMGVVYLASHVGLDRKAAIKVLMENLSTNTGIRQRFQQEAKLMAVLDHPNIVTLYDFTTKPKLSLIMEYVEGRSLDRMIGEEYGPIPHEKALPLFLQILEGIAYAHSRGVIHRDIKPSNVLVSMEGQAKITDLGIAKIAGQKGLTRTGAQMGTLYYESPEQIRGAKEVDHRADIYSLGMTLYEMLAGRLPFEGEGDTSEFQVMSSIVNRQEHLDPRDYYPHIPEWLVHVVQQATHLDPEERFQSCESYREALLEHADSSMRQSEGGYWTKRVSTEAATVSLQHQSEDRQPAVSAPEEECPSCGARVKDEMEFCGRCGTDLLKECPECHEQIRWHHEFCPKCGVNIGKKLAAIEAEKERQRELEEKRRREVEEKRIAEEKRQEKERKRREKAAQRNRARKERRRRERAERLRRMLAWWRKHWWKVAAAVILLSLGIGIPLYLSSDAHAYQEAQDLYESGQYEEAAAAFASLKDYRNASMCALECRIMMSSDSESDVCSGPLRGMLFIRIPSGSFSMGSSADEQGHSADEEPVHIVNVAPFELMATEVTQDMWEEVMGEDIYDLRDDAYPDWPIRGAGGDYPVYYVSWNDCQEFIDRIDDMDPSHTYRLPSEAEWEYACRAGTTTRYYWGDSDSESVMGRYCWFTENSGSSTHPVGTKEPNAWGLYDMNGNVSEWCEDGYHECYYNAPTDSSSWVSDSARYRVNRGGCWSNSAHNCRSANRYNSSSGNRSSSRGLRLARSVEL